MSPRPPSIAVDFDGVIHGYSKGWQKGEIYDDLVPGAKEGLLELHKRYRLILFTARHNLDDVRDYLYTHGLEHLFVDVTNRKPAAMIYLDDRAVRFTDWGTALGDIAAVARAA